MAEALQERIDREQRFVADVAHDLRTPVTGLVAAAALLEPDEIGRAIQDRARHLSRLVDDLLEIARLESGSATPDLRWVDVEALVREAAAGRDGIEVRGGEPCRALVDPRRLQRVVENLLGNAERHGRPPITVEISATQLAVADAGPGFPDDLLDRATERFATGDPARGEGIGLGLAIAAAQARVLGGRLELANRPEGGARAVVVLPRPMEAAP
jgi:signal transduction histidine kinase